MGELLNASSVDIICLQEVVTYSQLLTLKKQLKNYPYVCYKPFISGPKGGLVTFSKKEMSSVKYYTFTKKGSLHNATVYAHFMQTGMLMCTLSDTPLVIINTHFTANFDHDWQPSNRFYKIADAQMRETANVLDALATENGIVLMGDFNIGKHSMMYKKFVKDANVQDVFSEETSYTYDKERKMNVFKGKKSDRIDYIFLRSQAKISVEKKEQFFVDPVKLHNGTNAFLSDHLGLKAVLSFSL